MVKTLKKLKATYKVPLEEALIKFSREMASKAIDKLAEAGNSKISTKEFLATRYQGLL